MVLKQSLWSLFPLEPDMYVDSRSSKELGGDENGKTVKLSLDLYYNGASYSCTYNN
jgi:hypothetical protein